MNIDTQEPEIRDEDRPTEYINTVFEVNVFSRNKDHKLNGKYLLSTTEDRDAFFSNEIFFTKEDIAKVWTWPEDAVQLDIVVWYKLDGSIYYEGVAQEIYL